MNLHGRRAHDVADDLASHEEGLTLEDAPYVHAVLRIGFELHDFLIGADHSDEALDWIRGTAFSGIDSICALQDVWGRLKATRRRERLPPEWIGLSGSLSARLKVIEDASESIESRLAALHAVCALQLAFLSMTI